MWYSDQPNEAGEGMQPCSQRRFGRSIPRARRLVELLPKGCLKWPRVHPQCPVRRFPGDACRLCDNGHASSAGVVTERGRKQSRVVAAELLTGSLQHTPGMRMMFIVLLASVVALHFSAPAAAGEVVVATSSLHTLVVAPDGRVLCQGRNQYGVCGVDPATAFVDVLTPVPGIPSARAVAVADIWTSMVLGDDGKVYVWGRNDFGLFGGTNRGPTYELPRPTAVATLERIIGIAAFVHGGAALRDDGTVWMWGEDSEGLLATGTLSKSGQSGLLQYTPRQVAGLDGITQIDGGWKHMLALRSNKTVWAWGANKDSQLGLGDTAGRPRPTMVPSLAGVTRIHADGNMSAALQADGSWLL